MSGKVCQANRFKININEKEKDVLKTGMSFDNKFGMMLTIK